ncbi:ABC transporter, substrate-binding protein, family 3 [Bacteriovorax sp. Seq25_V]|nr:ABC transporter, substrate-binding protein, family 3 [Bacteriovorax sp. Seq25_V]
MLLALTLLVSSPLPSVAMEPISLITEEWPPYNYTENNVITGYSTELVQLIIKELGIKEDIKIYPSMRATQTLETSKRTMLFSFIKTKEREKRYKWIGPFGSQSIHFYKRKNSSLVIQSIADAKKVNSICSRSGGLIFNKLNELGFKNLDTSTRAKSIYLKTIIGRCDLAISETALGYIHWMKELNQPLDVLKETPVKVTEAPLYIVATKDIPDSEIEMWQKALKKVINSKEYIKIANKYGL